jgi:hypothetical protein
LKGGDPMSSAIAIAGKVSGAVIGREQPPRFD